MRKLRLKNDGEGFYHVGSRCVDSTFRFDDADKTHIVDQIRRMAAFCGMEVNTYSVMTNYIDCNAVRAGIVDRPEDYKWCGYAQAHAGREAAQKALSAIFRDSPEIAWAEAGERYGWLLHAVSDTPVGGNPEHDAVFRRALAIGSQGFILETYARFPKVFNARKRPAKPFVTDFGGADGAICASHKPRGTGVG